MRVRVGDRGDAEAAIAVWKASREARHGGIVTPPEREQAAREHLSRPDSFLVVAEDGAIVGMGLAMHAHEHDEDGPVIPGWCHVEMVFVAPERWGQGIGAGIVDALLDEARARRYRSIELWTGLDNVRAQRLYESRRFRRSGHEMDLDNGDRVARYERAL